MADQTFTATVAVENAASSELQSYAESWTSVSEAQDAAAESASTATEATSASEEAVVANTAALQELIATLQDASASTDRKASADTEEASAAREAAAAERERAESLRMGLEATSDAIDGNNRFMSGMGEMGLAALVGMEAVNKLKEVVTEYATAGAEAEKATAAMDATFMANTVDGKQQIDTIEEAAGGFTKYGITATQVEDIMSKMTPAIHNSDIELRALKDSANLAAAAHISNEQAATLLTRAYEQGGSALHRYGIYIDSTLRGVDVLTAVEQKYAGVADEVANTGAGAIDKLDASQKNLEEDTGKYFTDATRGWNDVQSNFNSVVDEQVKGGNAIAASLDASNKLLFDIPEKLATAAMAATGFGTDIKSAADMQDIFNTNLTDGSVTIGKFGDKTYELTQAQKDLAKETHTTAGAFDGVRVSADAVYPSIDSVAASTQKAEGFLVDGKNAADDVTSAFYGVKAAADVVEGSISAAGAAAEDGAAHFRNLAAAAHAAQVAMANESFSLPPTYALNEGIPAYPTQVGSSGQAAIDARNKRIAGAVAGDWAYNPTPPGGGGGAHKGSAGGAKTDPQALEDTAKQLQLTKDVTQATQALTQATKEVADADKQFSNATQKVNDALQANKEKEAADSQLNAAKGTLAADQQAQTQQTRADAAAANDLAVKIHDVTDQVKELDREAAQNMGPLQQNLKNDTADMNALDEATRQMDHTFTDTLNNISNEQYDLAQKTAADMKPFQAALDQANAAYTAAQEKVQGLAQAEADKLAPIDEKILDIQQAQQNLQRSKQLDNEAQSVANLSAQLQNTTKGSAEYLSLQKQLADANMTLGQDTQLDALTKQKNAIQDKYAVEIQAATKQEEAAAATQKAAQKAYDDEAKLEAQKKADLDEQAQTVAHQQALYDQQQSDKKFKEQDQLNADQAAITSAQAVADARKAADLAYLDELNNEQSEEQYNASQHSYAWGVAIAAQQDAVTKLEGPYNDEATRLGNLKQLIADQKTTYDENTQPILDHLKDIAAGEQATLDVFKGDQSNAKEADAWAKAMAAGGAGLAAMHDAAPDVGPDIAAIDKASASAATSAGNFATAVGDPTTGMTTALSGLTNQITTGIGPAIQGLSTTLDPALADARKTWMKYFGLNADQGADSATSLGIFFDHKNVHGFWGRMDESTTLALGKDGIQGTWDRGFDAISADIVGRATDMGNAIMGGIATGVSSDTAVKSLGDAITAAVEKAMAQAEQNLGIHSPSTESARRIGVPLGQGVAVGIASQEGAIGQSMRAATGGAFAGGYGSGSGSGGGTSISLDNLIVQLTLPNVHVMKDLSNDPNEWRDVAYGVMVAIDHEAEMRGLPRLVTQVRR